MKRDLPSDLMDQWLNDRPHEKFGCTKTPATLLKTVRSARPRSCHVWKQIAWMRGGKFKLAGALAKDQTNLDAYFNFILRGTIWYEVTKTGRTSSCLFRAKRSTIELELGEDRKRGPETFHGRPS